MSNSTPTKKNLKEKMDSMIFRVGHENVIYVSRLQTYTEKHTWPGLYACLKRQDPKFLSLADLKISCWNKKVKFKAEL